MRKLLLPLVGIVFIACSTPKPEPMDPNRIDTHSFSRPQEVRMTHLSLDLTVDFEGQTLAGSANFTLQNNKSSKAIFDIREMVIERIVLDNGQETTFSLGEQNTWGQALEIDIKPATEGLTIFYQTRPNAAALLWMDAAQTYGKRHPFVFTQGQAILTRSWIPIQDSPGIRITYDAILRVPEGLMALMSAENPSELSDDGIYHFKMEQPIPPYLIAMAVGDLAFAPISHRTGVYADPDLVAKAAWEFADTEKMVQAAEALYGPYDWERYDIFVLPPSFPFGGMENPRLTFATPTIIAGDRSLNALIAHELAHSWSGNLVTNATWNDFWLNEGFTVYFEARIMEALYGRDYAEMLSALERQELEATIAEMGADSPDTHLKLNLKGRNPDDGMNDIAYQKGYTFLRLLEEKAGRDTFDQFLKEYFKSNAFTSISTEDFIAYLNKHLLEPYSLLINVDEWVYGPGLPDNAPQVSSNRFSEIDAATDEWLSGMSTLDRLESDNYSTHEWRHFIVNLPADMELARMAELDKAFGLTQSTNAEIQAAWYEQALRRGYEPAYVPAQEFLKSVGRRKFLTPLYRAMMEGEAGREMALVTYAMARPYYHTVAVETLDKLLRVQAI